MSSYYRSLPNVGLSPTPTNSIEPFARDIIASSTISMTSGQIRFTYFYPMIGLTISSLRMWSASTAAGATPTLVRFGIYSLDANEDMTLACAIASDTSIFSGAFGTSYSRALSTAGGLPASFYLAPNTRYAFAVIVVTAAATPTMFGISGNFASQMALSPKPAGLLSGQTDLPVSVLNSAVNASSGRVYFLAA